LTAIAAAAVYPVALAMGGWLAGLAGVLVAAGTRWALRAEREAVARAAHELRGPLTAIGLGLELAARAPERGAAADGVLELELARARVALSDLSGARPGRRLALRNLERVEGEELVRAAVEAAGPAATAAGVDLTGRWLGPAAWVWGDRVRLAQALGNLIANAIEHGGGKVRVEGGAARGSVRIEVSDTGPGLPAPVAELARRARGGRGRRGRGLAIAGSIAAAHHGRLAAAPSSGGARLVLELPASAGREAESEDS